MTGRVHRQLFFHVLIVVAALAPVVSGAQVPDERRLMQHLSVLAADSMEGRAPGTRGHSAAAAYIENQLRALGVDGGAMDGTYRHVLPAHRVTVDVHGTRLRFSGATGAIDSLDARDFHVSGRSAAAYRSFSGTARWFGNAGEAGAALDSGVSMTGVVAVLMAGGGPLEPVLARLHDARAAGAVVLVPNPTAYAALREGRGVARHYLAPQAVADPAGSIPLVIVGSQGSERVRNAVGASGGRIELQLDAATTPISAWNVVGRVAGGDARRRDSVVVLMAHYDHIGISERRDGADSVYNGLVDNATGVAALLELARLVRARPLPYTAVFLFVTLEEEGSLGSQYQLAVDSALATRTVAAINLDHPPALAPPVHWYVETNDSSMARAGRAAAGALGGEAESLPPQPTSDHWRFMQRGIPTAFIVPGDRWRGVTETDIERLTTRWWRPHRLDDEWSPEFPVAGLATTVEYALRIARAFAR